MEPTSQARTVLAASFMSSMLAGMCCIGRMQALDIAVSAFAAVALIAGGLLMERAVVAAWRGKLQRVDAALSGVLFGLPLSFFFLQSQVARSVGDIAKAEGASRVVTAVGLILIVVSAAGAWRRRRAQRT